MELRVAGWRGWLLVSCSGSLYYFHMPWHMRVPARAARVAWRRLRVEWWTNGW